MTELEKGVLLDVAAQDEDYDKALRLKTKMEGNLKMASDRVNELLAGGELKGNSPPQSASTKGSRPTESLRILSVTPKETVPAKKKARGRGKPPAPSPASQRKQEPPSAEDEAKPSLKLKGVDSKLAHSILDEIVEEDSGVTWDNVVGLELPKRTLQEIVILPALRPELFTGLRSPARGLLLFGPPGNGKTMLAKAVAHESKAKFFNMSASSLTSKWVGEGEKLVKALFAVAREMQPSIIFLDEVDALLSRRGESEHDAMRRIKNEFLLNFDGMRSTEGERVLIMAATNRPHELDDAALRRFEKRIYVPLPTLDARKMVLSNLLTKHHNSITAEQLDRLGRACEGYSGSDLTALAKDAALGPIRDLDYDTLRSMPANKVRKICLKDFERSMAQIRPSVSPDLILTLEQWNSRYGVAT